MSNAGLVPAWFHPSHVEHTGHPDYRAMLTKEGKDPLDQMLRDNPKLDGFRPRGSQDKLSVIESQWAAIICPQKFGTLQDTSQIHFCRRREMYYKIDGYLKKDLSHHQLHSSSNNDINKRECQ